MDEHSELALQMLKGSLGELLTPLCKIDELFSKVAELQEDIQRLNSQLTSLRSGIDDSLEELKQSIRHKTANS